MLWLTGKSEGGSGLIPLLAEDFVAYMAFEKDPGASYPLLDFDFEIDPKRLEAMAAVYN